MRKKIILFVFFLIVIPLILFFIADRHSVSASLNFITKWGSYEPYSGGSTNGKFTNPNGVAIDTAGNIYVVDSGNNRVEVFNPDGTYVAKWGSYGNEVGQFNNPQGITTAVLSETTYVYVTDSNGVEKFQTDGTPVQHYGSGGGVGIPGGPFYSAQGVAVDSSGKVYVADSGSQYVQEFNPDGSYDTSISGVSGPNGVAVDAADNVYIADTGNNKIKEYTSGGDFVTQWDTINAPFGVMVDNSSGDVYVSDGSNNLVEKYNSSGTTLLKQWGSSGSEDGQFSQAEGIAVDSSGNVYVADTGNNRIEKFDSDGNYLSKIGYSLPNDGYFNTPHGIAVDSSNNVYVADTLNDRIQKFDDNGTYLTQWGTPGSGSGQLDNPYSLTVSLSNNNVYVVDSDNSRVEEFDATGNYITAWGSKGTAHGQFDNPQGIAVDSSGNVYVVDANNNRVEKFDSSGNFLLQWGNGGGASGQFSAPTAIAVDSVGDVYVGDNGNHRIQKFNTSGDYLGQWGGSGNKAGQFNIISGIGIDKTGNVYVVDGGNNHIQEFTATGSLIMYSGSFGTGNGQFNNPSGIAFDSLGNNFVVDTNNNRVQKFSFNLDYGPYYSNADINFYRGDGNTKAMAIAGNTLYIGGSFGLEAVDLSTGQKITWSPNLPTLPDYGRTVYSLAYSPENKILYVGTDCYDEGPNQQCLFEYDTSTSSGTLVTDFAPEFDEDYASGHYGEVYALKIVNDTLFIGGHFGWIGNNGFGSNTRVGLASFDISTPTATLTSWEMDTNTGSGGDNPTPDGTVYVITTSSADLLVGGDFTSINGVNQQSLAAIDLTGGNLDTNFAPGFGASSTIYALQTDDTNVYAGGNFSTVNSQTFNNLVSVTQATGGANLNWAPNTQYPVYALALIDNYLYSGESDGGDNAGFAEAYNVASGNSVDWQPQDTQPVYAMLAPDTTVLYVGLAKIQSGANLGNPNKTFAANYHWPRLVPAACADIGGLADTIYLAKFNNIQNTPTPTPTLTATLTPTSAPGPTSSSAPVCSDQKPGTPTNLQVTAGPGAQQATLSWTAPTGPVTDYSITYSNNPNTKLWGVASTGNVTTYVISNLPNNQNYYFWVNAVNKCMPGDPVGPQKLLGSEISSTSSAVINTSNSTASTSATTQNPALPPVSPLPPTGPEDTIKIGLTGIVLTIIGGALLLAF